MSPIESAAAGWVLGPGSEPNTFTLISPDDERVLKNSEFVIHRATVEGIEQEIISRIIARRSVRQYPSNFLADPSVTPGQMATLVGYAGTRPEVFELTAEMLGYFDVEMGDFANPRLLPQSGVPVYLAPDALLAQVLCRRMPGQIGAAEVGWLLTRPRGRVPVTLDVAAFTSTHLAIIASTGAGKSYLAGVIIEELLRPNNRAALLVIDPHAEYGTLQELNNHKDIHQGDDYRPEVRIYTPGQVKVRMGSLSLSDLRYLLPDLSERMEYVLGLAFRRAKDRSQREHGGDPNRWTLDTLCQIVTAIGLQADPENDDLEDHAGAEGGKYKDSADALLWRLRSALGGPILFDPVQQVDLDKLVRPGQCTVLQFNEVDVREQQVMVAVLLRRLYRARVDTTKRLVSRTAYPEMYLPYPVFVLLEEAHHFAPGSGNAVSADIIRTVLAEGRKFGLGVGLISQRPGKLDPDALSQCNTQCLMRIVNPVDQARVRESVESVGQELLRELPALTKGQVIIAGRALNTPVVCRVRPRLTQHGAQDLDAPKEWQVYFQEEQQAQRSRDTARPRPPSDRSRY